MTDWPLQLVQQTGIAVHSTSLLSWAVDSLVIVNGATSSGGNWPTANLAIFLPFGSDVPFRVNQFGINNGATVTGNFDFGVYDELGNRLVSNGGAAQTGASVFQAYDVTDTILPAGNYFIAMVGSGAGQVDRFAADALMLRCAGVKQMASAYPLPSTATFADMATAYYPGFGFTGAAVL